MGLAAAVLGSISGAASGHVAQVPLTWIVAGHGLSQPVKVAKLTGGMIYAEFAEGVKVVVPQGSVIDFGSAQLTKNGSAGEDWLSVTPPADTDSSSQPNALGLAQQVGMFTPEQATTLSTSRNGVTAAGNPEGCADIDTTHGWMHGCWERQQGTSSRYWGTKSIATFQSKGIYGIKNGKTKHDYHSTTEVRKWSPVEAIDKGSCGIVKLKVAYAGVGLETEETICPDKLSPDVAGGHKMHGVWSGSSWRSARSTMAIDTVYRNGSATGFKYSISFFWTY